MSIIKGATVTTLRSKMSSEMSSASHTYAPQESRADALLAIFSAMDRASVAQARVRERESVGEDAGEFYDVMEDALDDALAAFDVAHAHGVTDALIEVAREADGRLQ